MYLVKFDKNWADEFNVYGFRIMDYQDLDVLMYLIPFTNFSFGTNEGWEDGEMIKLRDFTITEISPITAQMLDSLFGKEWGTFPPLEDYLPWGDDD